MPDETGDAGLTPLLSALRELMLQGRQRAELNRETEELANLVFQHVDAATTAERDGVSPFDLL